VTIEEAFFGELSAVGRLSGNAAERFFWDDWSDDPVSTQESAQENLDDAEGAFGRTGNPIYAWNALVEARGAGIAVPDWVLQYLEGCGRQLWMVAVRSAAGMEPQLARADRPRAVAVALRLMPPGTGNKNDQFEAFFDRVGLHIALDAEWHLLRCGLKKQAYLTAAGEFNVSRSTVERAHAMHRSFVSGTGGECWADRVRLKGP
jgi:hypothetical protein